VRRHGVWQLRGGADLEEVVGESDDVSTGLGCVAGGGHNDCAGLVS